MASPGASRSVVLKQWIPNCKFNQKTGLTKNRLTVEIGDQLANEQGFKLLTLCKNAFKKRLKTVSVPEIIVTYVYVQSFIDNVTTISCPAGTVCTDHSNTLVLSVIDWNAKKKLLELFCLPYTSKQRLKKWSELLLQIFWRFQTRHTINIICSKVFTVLQEWATQYLINYTWSTATSFHFL